MTRTIGLLLATVAALTQGAVTPLSAANAENVYQAIRENDLARVKALVATRADANAPGEFGASPLMVAAAVGSVDAVKLLIGAGADVNAQNAFGSTALIWSATDPEKVRLLLDAGANPNVAAKSGRTALFVAAMTEGNAAVVRTLMAKGADVKIRDAFGNTMLNAAAAGNDLETIRLMLAAGIDVNAASVTGLTPLITAAYHGNAEAVRLLLSKGARVNDVAAFPTMFPIENPKSGVIALSKVTPLLAAAASHFEVVKLLLDAGADVNARDGRNMTPLMIAVATDRQDARILRLLLDHGADAAIQSNAGETAGDWARKAAAKPALDLLKVERLQPAHAPSASAKGNARAAAEKAVALLESSSQKFFESSGCVSCHHQNATDFAVAEARAKGLKVSAEAQVERMKMISDQPGAPPAALLLERMDIGVPEIFAATAAALAAASAPPNMATDLIAANIAATQAADGSWHLQNGIGDRPPTSVGAITRTALCIRALNVYAPPARAAEMKARIAKARDWLKSAAVVTSEDANMQLLGLLWAGVEPSALTPMTDRIRSAQQANGGWSQRDEFDPDAYATGQSLYVLAKAGALRPNDAAYQRGIAYLLASQADNGSWRVASRSPKFQAYFNSGFPYAGDQWISAWGTSWAVMALAQAAP